MDEKETAFLEEIQSRFQVTGRIQRRQRIWVSVDKDNLNKINQWLKKQGFDHLSAISVTDLLDQGIYEVTYHVWSYIKKILVTVKTRIDRKKPVIVSAVSIWKENAQIHERELHELFGVNFQGNPDLSPLFLEDWQGPPPFIKDFNWREYVQKKCYDKKNEREKVYYE